jgi:hypothetical protein
MPISSAEIHSLARCATLSVGTVFLSRRRLQVETHGRAAWAAATLLAASMTLHAQPCVENYTAEGAPATGMTFRTWQDFWSVERDEAFARAQASVAQDGYVITSADRANGVISTTQGVSGSTARVPTTSWWESEAVARACRWRLRPRDGWR